MAVELTADVTLNGGSIDATVYESFPDSDVTSTPKVNSASLDTSAKELTVDMQANGGSVRFTVHEDTDQDGTAETTQAVVVSSSGTTTHPVGDIDGGTGNDYWLQFDLDPQAQNSETVTLSDGTNTYTLSTLDGTEGKDYWIEFSLTASGSTSTPKVNSATVDTLAEQIINATVATLSASGVNAGLAAGPASITAQEATLSAAAQNAGLSATASISATVGLIDATGQNATVSPGSVSIQADAGVLQITAEAAARVFDSTTLSGTVTLDGSAVEGAKIYCIDDTNGNIAAEATTDANGDYKVRVDTGDTYHMVVQYEDDQGNQYNDESKPFLAT